MEAYPLDLGLVPPLRPVWRSTESLSAAVVSGGTLYGVAQDGSVVAVQTDTGAVRWKTAAKYRTGLLAAEEGAVYVYESGNGLVAIRDQGATFSEQTLLEISSLDGTTQVSRPVANAGLLHFVKGNLLLAVNKTSGGTSHQMNLSSDGPYTLHSVDNDLLLVSGLGRPARIRSAADHYQTIWTAAQSEAGAGAERPAFVEGDYVLVGQALGIAAYSKATGRRIWASDRAGNLAITALGDSVYSAGHQASLWSLSLSTGVVQWDRKYLAQASDITAMSLVVSQNFLWVGVVLTDASEPAILWAVNATDGNFAWQATSVSIPYGNGLPLLAGDRVYTYGSSNQVTAMQSLASPPGVTPDQIRQTPNPLRGGWRDFNPVEINLRLSVPAKVSFITWHERDERNNSFGPIDYQPGNHYINYDARWPMGWTDLNQFGRLVFEIEESSTGVRYSQILLVPINTLPDIHHHWAQRNIEIMIFHKFIGGYPDLTFKPDNLVTRGESSTIIAKTLGLERPSSGFRTKFIDISGHWARNYIMALEEQGILGGFREPDGRFTFRPNLNMTRAEEARILVRAYSIAAAPDGFQTRFTDIAGHWAEGDIKALEARGYVTGFREGDGSYTYRPEQNLTRAELCTVVVRVRNLTR